MCLLGDMVETISVTTDNLWKTANNIFKYVPMHILTNIFATQPESDVCIIECVNPLTKRRTRYAYWKNKSHEILEFHANYHTMGLVQN